MSEYVMIGVNRFLGEFLDLIRPKRGVLSAIVQNLPDTFYGPEGALKRRVQEFRSANSDSDIAVIPLEEFQPSENCKYVLGFHGPQACSLVESLKARFDLVFETLIHPGADVSPQASLGEGALINAGCSVASGVEVGRFAKVGRMAMVGHDAVIGPFALVQASSNIGGFVRIEEGAEVCMGATVIPDIVVGRFSRVAAGATVIEDVPPGSLVAGVPARVKKPNR